MIATGFSKATLARPARALTRSTRCNAEDKRQVIQPLNNDPFVGSFETPVTSAPIVATYLSNLPVYRTGVSPLLRGVEIGLAHGFLLCGPFIKLGPLRNVPDIAEVSGCLSGAGLVLILTVCLTMYGGVSFDSEEMSKKTLSGRELPADPLKTADGWASFTSGWLFGGLAGVGWAYACSQFLPFYS